MLGLGVIGGLLGVFFNAINIRLVRWRIKTSDSHCLLCFHLKPQLFLLFVSVPKSKPDVYLTSMPQVPEAGPTSQDHRNFNIAAHVLSVHGVSHGPRAG